LQFCAGPNANTVVYIPFIDCKAELEGRWHGKLVNSKIERGIKGSWRGAHGSAAQLLSVSAAELEDVPAHYQLQTCNDCVGGRPSASLWWWRKSAITVSAWSVSMLVYIDTALQVKNRACAGRGGKFSRQFLSSHELAMKDGSFLTRGWSWLSS
jgi:hypothetical protein